MDAAIYPKRLTDLQELVLRQVWEGKAYTEIAETSGYEVVYIKEVGSKLWQLLSKAFGEKVTKTNVQSVIRRQTQQASRLVKLPDTTAATQEIANKHHQDWGEAIDVSVFYGRTQELATLKQWIVQDRCRLVTLLGMGGIGKTALATKVVKQVQGEFEYLIWRSLRNANPVQEILGNLIEFLSNQKETDVPESIDGKVLRLLDYLRSSRCLVILDNIESILQSGDHTGRYRTGYEGYGQLLRSVANTSHQSCLVLTTREKPIGLNFNQGSASLVRFLQLAGLQTSEGQELLKAEGLSRTEDEKVKLIQFYGGNPLAMKMSSESIQVLFDGDISEFLKQGITVFNGITRLLEQQFNRLSELEKQIMYWLTINQEPVSLSKLQECIGPLVSKASLLNALESLRLRSLVERTSTGFQQQPMIREYMTEK